MESVEILTARAGYISGVNWKVDYGKKMVFITVQSQKNPDKKEIALYHCLREASLYEAKFRYDNKDSWLYDIEDTLKIDQILENLIEKYEVIANN